MASREKRALAPSKTKQKANNDSSSTGLSAVSSSSSSDSSSSTRNSSKKSGKQPLTNNTRAQLAREIFEAVATGSQLQPKIEAGLPRRRALQTALKRKQKAKKTLIKAKQKVPIKALKRIADAKKILNKKKKRQRAVQNLLDNSTEVEDTKNKGKSGKKSKLPAKTSEEADSEGQDKSSPKLGKKVIENSPRSVRSGKTFATQRRNDSKERDLKVKRSISKEPEEFKVEIKTEPDDNSYEVTIEAVIASSMLVEPKVEVEGDESASEGELKGKKNLPIPIAKRSLRNGKLRQPLIKTEPDSDRKRASSMSEASVEGSIEMKSLEGSNDVLSKLDQAEESDHTNSTEPIETNNNGCESGESNTESRIEEIGPTLRSKTKARSSDGEVKDEIKLEDNKTTVKSEIETTKKERTLGKLADIKASTTGAGNTPKSRRSSFNIDMRRGSLYSGNVEKFSTPDGSSSKSQIDEMIDKIKMTIAKTIESKIYKQDTKGLILGKGFEMPKIEDIITPLSNDTTMSKLETDIDENKPNASKSREQSASIGSSLTKKELKTEDTEITVPKVADTAKEIEKLVMGDIEPVDCKPLKDKSEDLIKDDAIAAVVVTENIAKKEKEEEEETEEDEDTKAVSKSPCKNETDSETKVTENLDESDKESSVKSPDEPKKTSPPCPTRKSTRVMTAKKLSASEICHELEKSDELDKKTQKEKDPVVINKCEEEKKVTEESTVPEKPSKECNEDIIENNTVTAMEVSLEEEESIETPTTEKIIEEKMEVDESIETEKAEETLESLSREVEKLVEEDDNEKSADKVSLSMENDASCDEDEMRLMIDEEVPDSEKMDESSSPQNTNDNDGCDEKSTSESPDDVQKVDITVESTISVPENLEDKNSTTSSEVEAVDGKSNEVAKTKSIVVEETEEEKETREKISTSSPKLEAINDKSKEVIKPKSTEVEEIVEQKETRRTKTSTSSPKLESVDEKSKELKPKSTETEEIEEQKETRRTRASTTSPKLETVNDKSKEVVKSKSTEVAEIEEHRETRRTKSSTSSPKLEAVDDKSKEVVKPISTDTEEIGEQKETRRVLRARGDKQKKTEVTKSASSIPSPVVQEKSDVKVKSDDAATSEVPLITTEDTATIDTINKESSSASQTLVSKTTESIESTSILTTVKEEQPEPQIRTRRSREVKKPLPVQVKGKRGPKKQESKKVELQHEIKEETLLDNEVAKINENDRLSTYPKSEESVRGVSANAGNTEQEKLNVPEATNRSKSENDLRSTNVSSDILKSDKSALSTVPEAEPMDTESKVTSVKDSDEASTSGESSSSSVEKILETPEDRAKKEDILRQLGLESWERVKERKAKKEQQYTGTLKTVIRLQKDKDGKKRSRSPLKMVLKQQGRMDGEESFDYYTIQKEFGTSGLGDSSSGANRKLSTNPRHSCDEDNEDAPLKDRQSLVIPEKSSSFSIHPGRLCADNCCYCHGKFGSLDTPMHLAQMKSDERRKKILENEVHLTKDSCLCDACYRHVDRKANSSPTNLQLKPQRQNRQSMLVCTVRNCSEPAGNHVKRRWLLKIKSNIRPEVDINWESTQQNLMTFCGNHYAKIEKFLVCTLCQRRLTRNYTYPVGLTPPIIEELNKRLKEQGIPAEMLANTFICRLCRYFIKLYLKHVDLDSMTDNNKDFHRKYKKKLLYYHELNLTENQNDRFITNSKNKEKNRAAGIGAKKSKCNVSIVKLPCSSKSPDNLESQSTSTSEKSTPEPPQNEPSQEKVPEPNERQPKVMEPVSISITTDTRFSGIEGAIEKLKKRKALDTTTLTTSTNSSRSLLNCTNESSTTANNGSVRDVVEILAMDKEVTLTRLPKRPRIANSTPNNDITPVVQRLGANPSISVRTLFPGEEEMNLHANVEFNNVREVTPQGWEKCATMIQYDRDTKLLWQELQRPYGNQSSFLRHLILLEKYYRAGDLILAPNASRNAINYSTSVQNRLISYEGPEKPEERIMEQQNTTEFNNSRRLSGGYMLEHREHNRSGSSTLGNTSSFANVTSQLSKLEASSRVMKLTPGVSIIKKPPPNLQRLNLSGGANGSAKRKESIPVQKGASTGSTASGKVIQLTEPDFKRLQSLKRQKQMLNERHNTSSPSNISGGSSSSPLGVSYTKAQQLAAQSQFQKHLRMQQEMLNQRSRGDFEPLICDIRTLSNENTPTQNLINNLNLPKSIQVTTKPIMTSSTPIPILPKIPKSLTVIPQTVARSSDK